MIPATSADAMTRIRRIVFEDLAIGTEFVSRTTYLVTASEIKRYAAQWDPQPYHLDEEAARQTPVGRLFAPSILTLAICVRLSHDSGFRDIATVAGLGIDELRMLKPVVAGDRLGIKATVVSLRESKSRPQYGVMTTRFEAIRQSDEIVMRYLLSGLVNKRT